MAKMMKRMQAGGYFSAVSGSRILIIAAMAAVIAVAVFAVRLSETATAQSEQLPPPVGAEITDVALLSTGLADVVEAVSPTVVAIGTEAQRISHKGHGYWDDFQRKWGLDEFPFFDFRPEKFRNHGPSEWFEQKHSGNRKDNGYRHEFRKNRPLYGVGSGVIFDPRGYVVTNAHVVENARTITVTMPDGETYDADIMGVDEFTDLAILKIDSGEIFPYAQFGDSDSVRVGDLALALGTPFGFHNSVSFGIVSAKHRDNLMRRANTPLIQTDAAINRGNSGGQLFNVAGEIIGINTLIFSPSGANSGVGFAIPSSFVEEIANELMNTGSIERGKLGVTLQKITDEIGEALGLESTSGALVASVEESTAASKAGVQVGDVIVKFDGKAVEGVKQLARQVRGSKPGSNVMVEVLRNGESIQLEVELGGYGTNQAAQLQDNGDETMEQQPRIGVKLAALSDWSRDYFGIDEQTKGVIIVAVESESAAEEAGLRPGDLILGVSNKRVDTAEEVVDAIGEAANDDKDQILFLIGRAGDQQFLTVGLS